ncbi:hypothetical protein K2173_026287 [Erythroxylum novogranatense]|uniref:C2H2-type domain-containing protein n=1 Tax=Erythroxylum novogranatense TaxID=1862640 RepID=A0AAV8SBT2_9ROSI|nr:hypothetical protein K2173_026287 [Erythroxylum novogranatense]
MSNISVDEGSFSSGNTGEEIQQHQNFQGGSSGASTAANGSGSGSQQQQEQQQPVKKKRNLPGTPDPSAEVVALSPTTLMATNRFVCEICNKGFQRDQNLQLHRRGHNLPWKLRQRTTTEVKKRVYICPEPTCVHHNPSRALGDLTGIKKHFSRKHGEKKWKCDKCSKKYAVQSDWKAHQKTCGTREYKCDCGTIFSRRDSFITHRAFCDALAEENNKVNQGLMTNMASNMQNRMPELISSTPLSSTTNSSTGMSDFNNFDPKNPLKSLPQDLVPLQFKPMNMAGGMFSSSSGTLFGRPRGISSNSNLQLSSNGSSGFGYLQDGKNGCQLPGLAQMSATALLQKAAQMGAAASSSINSPMMQKSYASSMAGHDQVTAIRPPIFGGIQQHNGSYDHFSTQSDQTNMVGVSSGEFNKQEISALFDTATGGSAMNDNMGMFASMFASNDHNPGFMRNMEHEDSGSPSLVQGRSSAIPTVKTKFGGGTGESGDMHTHDFLGIGGVQRHANLHQQQHQHQQRMGIEAMGQQRMPIMNHYQQNLSLGEAGIEKSIWDV